MDWTSKRRQARYHGVAISAEDMDFLSEYAKAHPIEVDDLIDKIVKKGVRELRQGTSELRVILPEDRRANHG